MPPFTGPSRALIDLDAYTHNLEVVRRFAGRKSRLIAVVKADAYGHGAVPIARAALAAGAFMLGVATVDEGARLRAAGITAPVLLMINPTVDGLDAVVEHALTLAVSDMTAVFRLGELARERERVVRVHVKVDTGMGRQGFLPDELPAALDQISRITHVDIEGVSTHFPCADIADDPGTVSQIKLFRQLIKQAERAGVPFELAHAANSAAVVNYPDSLFDAVRPGLMTYGVWPAEKAPFGSPLRRVLRWETRVVQVRDLPRGTTIGYGRTFTAEGPIRTAVLPVGYADGYRTAFANNADVLIRGRRCPVLGRVSMDQVVVDVSAVPNAAYGDPAVLIGADGTEEITVEELARRAGTIPYDILTGIGPRVAREYRGGAAGEAGHG